MKKPFELDYAGLLKLPQVTKEADVHCVTGWSMLGGQWKGVQIAKLAEIAGMKGDARYVIFEAAHGYTANVPLKEATADNALITYRLNGKPFALAARRAGARPRARPLLLEEREVDHRRAVRQGRQARATGKSAAITTTPIRGRRSAMAEVADEGRATPACGPIIKKRWRGWLRAVHRDFGYLAVGFTVIYAVCGIAHQSHRGLGRRQLQDAREDADDRADPRRRSRRRRDQAVTDAAGIGKPDDVFRAGDEIRLELRERHAGHRDRRHDVTIQGRERAVLPARRELAPLPPRQEGLDVHRRHLRGAAALPRDQRHLHDQGPARPRWRGAILIGIGVAVPVTAVLLSGPDARAKPASVESATTPAADDGGIKFLPPDQQP